MEPSLHRRKSSKDGDEIIINEKGLQNPESPTYRARVHSSPLNPSHSPPVSAGLNRTSFSFPRSPNGLSNGTNGAHTPPFRPSFSHGRTPSLSNPFHPSASSPLSSAFPSQQHTPTSPSRTFPITTSSSAPEQGALDAPAKQSRRHARIHSRNLSVFFPRPGALSHATISEDGAQEVEFQEEAPVTTIPSGNGVDVRTPLGAGFKFGTKAPNGDLANLPPLSPSVKKTTSRRGHHHKHSLSHNFFSFMEPGSQPPPASEVQQSTSSNPESPFTANNLSQSTKTNGHPVLHSPVATSVSYMVRFSVLGQFLLGAWIWVAGQQRGSLSTTGLGYWVVFDALSIAVSQMLPIYLGRSEMNDRHRRSYGNARTETVALFSCAIYLMFSAVYVCKEAVEHVLLSAGGEGHHHHGDEGDDSEGVKFPIFLLSAAILSLTATSLSFQSHSKMANLVGNRLPSIKTLWRQFISASSQPIPSEAPIGAVGNLLSNPYSLSPLFFSSAILSAAVFLPLTQQRMADLLLAFTVATITSKIAYQASVVLGVVLLQTSPSRGQPGGNMESFLRTMREVERHPQIFHLPAPHVWQLTPSEHSTSSSRKGTTVVTMELHVRDDLSDDDVLTLTKWTYEKVVAALRSSKSGEGRGHDEAEVTIGVVRG